MSETKIIANQDNEIINNIKSNIGSPHGASILAMAMINKFAKGLEVEINTNSYYLYHLYKTQLPYVWINYKPSPSIIRNYKLGETWTDLFSAQDKGQLLFKKIETPDSYKGNNVMEIEEQINSFEVTILNYNEPNRKLIIRLIQ